AGGGAAPPGGLVLPAAARDPRADAPAGRGRARFRPVDVFGAPARARRPGALAGRAGGAGDRDAAAVLPGPRVPHVPRLPSRRRLPGGHRTELPRAQPPDGLLPAGGRRRFHHPQPAPGPGASPPGRAPRCLGAAVPTPTEREVWIDRLRPDDARPLARFFE